MASTPSDVAAPAGESPTFTLQIISPSVAVPQPLNFTNLPASNTVRQLKERIRDAIDSKPGGQAQRLIHRGRLLARDDDTMLDIFGEDMIRSAEPQTLHLVVRDLSDARPASTQIPANSGPNAPSVPNQPAGAPQGAPHPPPQQQAQLRNLIPHLPLPQLHPGVPLQNLPFGFQQPQTGGLNTHGLPGNMPPGFNPQQFQQLGNQRILEQRQRMANMADPHHRLHELFHRNQREMAAAALNGAQDGQPAPAAGVSGNQVPGRNASPHRPDGTRTVVREAVGPNGQSWRITVNETVTTPHSFQRNARTGSPFSPANFQNTFHPPGSAPQPPRSVPLAGPHGGQLSEPEVQNIIRAADAGQAATRVMADAMRRNTSNSSLVNLANNQTTQPILPGVTTPLVPSRTGSAMGTPDPVRAVRNGTQPTSHLPSQNPTTPEVYILSSPEGPRALLLNGNLGSYFTPQDPHAYAIAQALQRQSTHQQALGQLAYLQNLQAHQNPQVVLGNSVPAVPRSHAVNYNPQHQQPQGQAALPQGLPPLPHAQPHIGHAVAQPGNVQVRAIAVAQIWPHIWMVIRLALFVWWFTSPTASWQRWFTVTAIAFTLFLVNTGLLTPIAEQFWTPVRRHLENLMPAADNHGRDQPARAENAQAENENGAAQGVRRNPDPAETAARLMRERRVANGNWLMAQARRLERAGILFLASIAPGVAERHIAHLEAEARAERQRREAAEAAAAEAARLAAENAENAQNANGEESVPVPEPAGDEAGPARQQNPEEPLIAI